MGRSRDRTIDTRAWVTGVVRSGLGSAQERRRGVAEAIRADHPGLDAQTTATTWIAEAEAAWDEASRSWPAETDHDRLIAAFAALEARGVVVLVGCADHWAARDELARRDPRPRGIAWFTPSDVWHAIDEGMLEVNLWHPTNANAAPGDDLLDEVLAAFAEAGLPSRFDEGRIEVTAGWQRRPASP